MDRPGRTFFALVAVATILLAYTLCAYVAFIAAPLLEGAAPARPVLCLAPAMLLGVVLMAAAWRGGRKLGSQIIASRKLAGKIGSLASCHPPRLRAALEAQGMRHRVDLVEGEDAFSFVYGFFVPRIAISRGLLEALSDRELLAALRHEQYHVRNLDPLRAVIAATVADGFFLLPYLGVLRARYEAERELAADRHAERACGRRALLGALVKALDGPCPERAPGAALAGPGLLEARVERLETGQAPRLSRLDVSALASSIYGLVAFGALFVMALLGAGGTALVRRVASVELSGGAPGLACLLPFACILAITLWRHLRATSAMGA